MKKFSWLLVAALPLVLFFSCQKQIASTAASRTPEMMAACGSGPATAVTEVSTFAQDAALAGAPVTLTYGVTYPSLPAYGTNPDNNGKYQLFRWNDATSAWVLIKTTSVSTPSSTFTFTPSADSIGDCAYQFRVHFIDATGPLCIGGHKYSAPNTDKDFCVKVVSACTTPISLKGKVTCVSMDGDVATITMVYTVKTCGLSGSVSIKTQGGLTAGGVNGATLISAVASSGATVGISTLNNNYVISATETFTANDSKTYTLIYQRVLVTDDSVSGQWSSVATGYTVDPQAPLPAGPGFGCSGN